MITVRLKELLVKPDLTPAEKKEILPDDICCPEYEDMLDDAQRQVKTLQSQRDELKLLIPRNAANYDVDFEKLLQGIACRFLTRIIDGEDY